jgi:hypothetical protein
MMQKKGDMEKSMSPKQALADYFQSPNQLMTFHLPVYSPHPVTLPVLDCKPSGNDLGNQ